MEVDSPLHKPTQNEVDQLKALSNAGRNPDMESQPQLLVERHHDSRSAWKINEELLGSVEWRENYRQFVDKWKSLLIRPNKV